MNHFISVIVPVYNVEEYIDRCIRSILGQDYRFFELILVDDGSTDRSGMLCDKEAKFDARIRAFHKPNGGLSDARNYGVQYARGDLITFIDSDDCVAPDYLSYLLHLLESGADIACCNFKKFAGENCDFETSSDVDIMSGTDACLVFWRKTGYYGPPSWDDFLCNHWNPLSGTGYGYHWLEYLPYIV